jgi:hypothetical protein
LFEQYVCQNWEIIVSKDIGNSAGCNYSPLSYNKKRLWSIRQEIGNRMVKKLPSVLG